MGAAEGLKPGKPHGFAGAPGRLPRMRVWWGAAIVNDWVGGEARWCDAKEAHL